MSGKNPLHSDKYMDTHSRVSSSISGGTHAQAAVQPRYSHNPVEKPTYTQPELRVIEGGKSFPSSGAKNNPPKNQAIPKSLLKRLPPAVLAHPFLWAAVITVVVGKVILEKDDTDVMTGEPFKESDPEEGVNYLVQEIKKYDPDYTYSHDKDEKGVSFLANLLHYEKLNYYNKHRNACRQDFNPDLYTKTVRDLDAREDILNTLYGSEPQDDMLKREHDMYQADGGTLSRADWIFQGKPDALTGGRASGNTRTIFTNRVPEDALELRNYPALTKDQALSIPKNILYVVKEDGTLVIAPKAKDFSYGHIDLANGEGVLAAGEGKIVYGQVKHIDNASGHYLPQGTSAQEAAIDAFKDYGFKVSESAYIEKVYDFNLRRWVKK